jgi:hypothetical protein
VVRLKRIVPILRQLLRALCVLLEQIVRLRKPQQPLDQRLVVVHQRLHACRECLEGEWRWKAVGG